MPKGGAKAYCSVPGCDKPCRAWGLCGLHYGRSKRTGSVEASIRAQARAEQMAADGTRQCFKCGQRKPWTVDHFPRDHQRGGKLKGTCRDCLRRAVKFSTLSRSYGLSGEDFERMLAAQGGRCRLCGARLDGARGAFVPHVDHCHTSGRVRGLLCHHCNVLLGHAKESPTLLRAAANYVEDNRAIET
mgnify:FL=1